MTGNLSPVNYTEAEQLLRGFMLGVYEKRQNYRIDSSSCEINENIHFITFTYGFYDES